MTREQLEAENAALRDLLAAVSLAADTVPVSKDNDYSAEWKRSTRVLAYIKNAADLSDWDGYLTWAAGEVRALAAEPVGYEVYAEPEDADDEYRLTAKGEAVAGAFCPDAYAAPGVEYYCTLKAGHKGLHAQLTSTGAFIAEWGYEDGHVHTTSGHYPAHPQGNLYPDGTPWCAQCGTHHRVPATPAQDEHPAQVAS